MHPGEAPSHGDTTYFSVADDSGIMVSMIQSNFRGMGSGLVADGLGFMFQDRGELFSLVDGHPNLYLTGRAIERSSPSSPASPPARAWRGWRSG